MKYNINSIKPRKGVSLNVRNKLLSKTSKNSKTNISLKKDEGDTCETEVILSNINLEDDSDHKIDIRLETIREESVETFTEDEEERFEKKTRFFYI